MKNRTVCLLSLIPLLYMGSSSSHFSKPRLTNPIIKWLDNKPFALDWKAMGDVIHARREVRKIQHGCQDQITKKFVGFYTYDGALRTVRWFAEYETALTQEFMNQKTILEKRYSNYGAYKQELEQVTHVLEHKYDAKMHEQLEVLKRSGLDSDEHEYQITCLKRALKNEYEAELYKKEEEIALKHVDNKSDYQTELLRATSEYRKKLQTLIPSLAMAVTDFITAMKPFMMQMEGSKTMILKLVVEFCLKYQRPYSFLLDWVKVEDGQEFALFQKQMTSCRALDEACTDLADFLEALYYSCEKARAEFEAKERAKRKK